MNQRRNDASPPTNLFPFANPNTAFISFLQPLDLHSSFPPFSLTKPALDVQGIAHTDGVSPTEKFKPHRFQGCHALHGKNVVIRPLQKSHVVTHGACTLCCTVSWVKMMQPCLVGRWKEVGARSFDNRISMWWPETFRPKVMKIPETIQVVD